ncbi:2195_t:CDS:2 [Acaulospora morrowiae]|uniref:Glutaredoxin-like protein n=1 Tax=Acaulospora morrowiae TaxID=94023 RepID=A0A9N9G3B5_9GLOM|nr:2195_t:CDS:2 [Acaulospora morrowiae]
MSTPARRIVLTLFTSKQCSLCVDAKHSIEQIPFELIHKDIKLPENFSWFQRYKYDIPILHLNNQFLFKHRVSSEKLETVLKKYLKNGIISKEDCDQEVV